MNSDLEIIKKAATMLRNRDWWYDPALGNHVSMILCGPFPLMDYEIRDLEFAIRNAEDAKRPPYVLGAKTWT